MSPIVEVAGATKHYGKVHALCGVDLSLETGRVHALLGPNGAGKTTLVRMLATLVVPDAGRVRVAGFDVAEQPREVRRVIGLAGQYAAVESAMTGRENLRMVGRLSGLTRRDTRRAADDVLDRLGLAEVADRLVGTYSGGLRRRLDLGASLVGRPSLLLLDEPTTGLDPVSRRQLWDVINDLVRSGTDVLLTTQYLEEADLVADHVVIIDRGRVRADGTPDDLKKRMGGDMVTVVVDHGRDLPGLRAVLDRAGKRDASIDEDALTGSWVSADGGGDAVRMVRELADRGIHVGELTVRRPSLDEVFLRLIAPSGGTAEAFEATTEVANR